MDTKEKRAPSRGVRKPAARPRRSNTAAGRSATKRPPEKKVTRTRKPAPKAPSADVVYTQPGPFNKYRFLLYLATVVAVVLAIIFGMSIFFKVSTVTVAGNEKYTAWDVREASGIQDGENLFSISEPRISNSITKKLPYVKSVRVGIKLPDTVKIEIVEYDVVYAVEATDGNWWLMRSDGGLTEKVSSADAKQHTKIYGFALEKPEAGKAAVAFQPVPEGEETTPITVYASEQLAVSLTIVQYLENVGIIGDAKSINVSDIGNLEIQYGDDCKALLGDNLELGYKIRKMKAAFDKMGGYQSGILDASFTIKPNEAVFTPVHKEK